MRPDSFVYPLERKIYGHLLTSWQCLTGKKAAYAGPVFAICIHMLTPQPADWCCVQVLQEQFSRQDKLRSLFAFTVPDNLSLKCNVALKSWQACMMDQRQKCTNSCPLSQCNIVSQRLGPHHVQL